jgi:hypothetical protein
MIRKRASQVRMPPKLVSESAAALRDQWKASYPS